MPKRPPFLHGQNRCIFCDHTGMSKEHIWPDWMEELFPRSDSDQHNQFRARFRLDPSGETIVTQSTKTRPGHASTKHVRKVCNICNNGWMSEMEKRTKPLLLALARGEPCNIDFILQNLLGSELINFSGPTIRS